MRISEKEKLESSLMKIERGELLQFINKTSSYYRFEIKELIDNFETYKQYTDEEWSLILYNRQYSFLKVRQVSFFFVDNYGVARFEIKRDYLSILSISYIMEAPFMELINLKKLTPIKMEKLSVFHSESYSAETATTTREIKLFYETENKIFRVPIKDLINDLKVLNIYNNPEYVESLSKITKEYEVYKYEYIQRDSSLVDIELNKELDTITFCFGWYVHTGRLRRDGIDWTHKIRATDLSLISSETFVESENLK